MVKILREKEKKVGQKIKWQLDPLPQKRPRILRFLARRPQLDAKLRNFERLPATLRYALLHSVWSENWDGIIVKNSKAGCTTITQLLYQYLTGDFYENCIHHESKVLRQGFSVWADSLDLLRDRDIYKVTTVRSPVERAISMYRDFAGKKNPSWKIHERALRKYDVFSAGISTAGFDNFMSFLKDFNGAYPICIDRHFRRQVINLALDYIKFDDIFKIELSEDWINRLFPASDETVAKRAPKFNQSSDGHFFISDHALELIWEIYKEDFTEFGYSIS